MKLTKKTAAFLLSLIMALMAPIMVFAEDAQFTLTADYPKLYAGMTYEITAKITNANEALYSANSGFTWSIASTDGTSTISSKQNYRYDSSTGTITEAATFVMPAATNTATITATLGNMTQTFATSAALQPIENYNFTFYDNEHAYYDSAKNTLFLDRKSSSDSKTEYAEFTIDNITPVLNDDSYTFYVFDMDGDKVSFEYGPPYKITLSESIKNTAGMLTCATESGKKTQQVNFQPAIPLESYVLSATPENGTKLNIIKIEKEGDMTPAGYTTTAGTTVVLSRNSPSPSASNDKMKYSLYMDSALSVPAPEKYYTTVGNDCTVNIDVAGTYYMLCQNVSVDGGKLKRKLEKIKLAITVTQAYPIQKIELFTLNEQGVRTDEPLRALTLYTNADDKHSTFNLAPCVSTDPDATTHTDSLIYSSSDKTVASIDETGKIKALKKGTTYIWVKSRDNSGAVTSLEVTIKDGVKAINSISTQSGAVNIPAGHVVQMVAETNPATVDEPIYWSSSNKDVLSINATTGVATAKAVNDITPVIVYATSDFGVSNNTPINVIPAIRATSLTLSASSTSATFSEEQNSSYKTYSDFYRTSNRPSFTVEATTTTAKGETTNDDFVWTVSFNGGVGLSLDEAVASNLLTYVKNTDSSYDITPLKLGPYIISCRATVNVQEPQNDDPSDTIIISLKQTANAISIVNESTGANADSTIYLPIGGKSKLTVKTSTPNNNKEEDPPVFKILSGGDYVNITEEVSDDKEGKTYTIEGLSYGMEATKIQFLSKSGSISKTITFYVRNSLSDATVINYEPEIYYTGKAITFPSIALELDGTTIDPSQYETPKYKNNINAGTATITFTGKTGSSYSFGGTEKTITFAIKPLDVSEATLSQIKEQSLSQSTRVVTPVPTVKVNGTSLTKDRDFTISYSNNDRAGTATATITGIGNYCGTCSTTFNIVDVASSFSIGDIANMTYTGNAITPIPEIYYDNVKLVNNVDYTLTYSRNTVVGTATVTITGKGRFKNSTTKTFQIVSADISKAQISAIPDQALSKSVLSVSPVPTIKINGTELKKNTDFTLSYANNDKAGVATVTITGKGNFSGSCTRTFKVVLTNISKAEISEISVQALSDSTRNATPTPTVRVDGTSLRKDIDYTISYSNNDRAGTATATFTGKGNYCGTCKATFKITDVASQFSVNEIPAKAYTGKEIKPVPVVYYKGKKLVNGKDFYLEYSRNVDIGTATVYIYGMNSFKSYVSTTFTIKPKKEKITKLKKAKKAFTVKWGKQPGVTGYQIQYSTNRKFKKGVKTKKIADSNVNSLKVKKLKKKKKYYVRVRSYKVIGNTTLYGAWSPVKNVKTK